MYMTEKRETKSNSKHNQTSVKYVPHKRGITLANISIPFSFCGATLKMIWSYEVWLMWLLEKTENI